MGEASRLVHSEATSPQPFLCVTKSQTQNMKRQEEHHFWTGHKKQAWSSPVLLQQTRLEMT